ncbi:MAG TPA: hypothetical protein VF498_17305, partial [Anaerolineales bacterium]
MSESDQLQQAIVALEAQRAILGDSIVDTALAPLREKLALLQDQANSHKQSPEERPGSREMDVLAEPQVLGEQRKLVTVLFADLVGFTAL